MCEPRHDKNLSFESRKKHFEVVAKRFFGLPERINLLFGDHELQGYIPATGLKFRDFLEFVCKSDKVWSRPLSMPKQKFEATIVIPSAHTQTVTLGVKSDEWHQHHIDFPGPVKIPFCGVRLRNAVLIA